MCSFDCMPVECTPQQADGIASVQGDPSRRAAWSEITGASNEELDRIQYGRAESHQECTAGRNGVTHELGMGGTAKTSKKFHIAVSLCSFFAASMQCTVGR